MFNQYYPNLREDKVLFGKSKIFMKNNMLSQIQKVYNEVTKKKHEIAMRIQRSFFRFKQLKKFRNGVNTIKVIKALWQKELLRRELKKKQQAATKIQRFYRQRLIVRRARALKSACYTLQTYVKSHYTRLHYLYEESAACIIQNAIRDYLAYIQARTVRILKAKITVIFVK